MVENLDGVGKTLVEWGKPDGVVENPDEVRKNVDGVGKTQMEWGKPKLNGGKLGWRGERLRWSGENPDGLGKIQMEWGKT